jgi:hypothetical protein
MKNFLIATEYMGITNSQMYADRYNDSRYSEITGFKNVEVIMALTKLNKAAAEDLSFVVSNLTEEEIETWIAARVNELFTATSLLFDSRENKIKNQKIILIENKIKNYFQWETINDNLKFPFEVDKSKVDWDLPPVSVLQQLYPKRYQNFITENNLVY